MHRQPLGELRLGLRRARCHDLAPRVVLPGVCASIAAGTLWVSQRSPSQATTGFCVQLALRGKRGTHLELATALLGHARLCKRQQHSWLGDRAGLQRSCSFCWPEQLEDAPPRWDPTAPVFTEEELQDTSVGPADGHSHEYTLVYLHAFGRCGKEYTSPLLERLSPGFPCPWMRTGDFAPGLRVVLPTARKLHLTWGPVETCWHDYASADSNDVGDTETLHETRQRLASVLREEIALLGGRARRVFLGGLSQGCTAALDVYLREGKRLGLGGFVGSVGFLPSDASGFVGASRQAELLLQSGSQAKRPLWLQCATDDQWVPWESLAEPSLQQVKRKLPGFKLKLVSGRGHIIDDWEGRFLEAFMRAHAKEAF